MSRGLERGGTHAPRVLVFQLTVVGKPFAPQQFHLELDDVDMAREAEAWRKDTSAPMVVEVCEHAGGTPQVVTQETPNTAVPLHKTHACDWELLSCRCC